jgi:hypothetical protein
MSDVVDCLQVRLMGEDECRCHRCMVERIEELEGVV